MAGTLPKTALLLTNYGTTLGHFNSYGDIARHLGISISGDGQITFMDERVYPTYIMKEDLICGNWTKEGAINDWARCYMEKNLPSSFHIYRYLC